ncbi:XVIPCD domain-containing protein [Lysobacter gummosus]|uniref:X-Tfes XVIPCD domain-containing protein n=1 Tax=Lysobacter gummosus TaxID=262324 RepID=A0ABY3XFK9_9GAMM|nr:XVIPCD domain-containing protein [Lysobacter gummosus]ALN89825.1 hypothetical protein LG3211_0843 [Lysobacter gummosus]UNP30427.1 hypothetical protein MOV92_03890 [Lysobacter gummosus]
MSKPISADLQKLLDDFGKQPGVSANAVKNLTDTIKGSPALTDQLNGAVAAGHLKSFKALTDPNMGGAYNGGTQTMSLPVAGLDAGFNKGEITFVLGHEVQHGFNRAARDAVRSTFYTEAQALAKNPAAVHDYTPLLNKVIEGDRVNESTANIAGWNALVSAAKEAKPTATLGDVYNMQPGRASDFIARTGTAPNFAYAAKPGLTLEADLTIAVNPANTAGMAKYYYDLPPASTGLGYGGNSDYPNYHGAIYLPMISQWEQAHGRTADGGKPQVHINMNSLHLNREIMETNGLDLGTASKQPYFDTSTTPPTAANFHHTKDTHRSVRDPIAPTHDAPSQTPAAGVGARAAHGNDPLLQGIRDQVQAEFARHGSPLSERDADRVSAALAVQSKNAGMGLPDHVVLSVDPATKEVGKTVFLVKGELDSPSHTRVSVSPQQAPALEDSLRQLESAAANAPAQSTQQAAKAIQQ